MSISFPTIPNDVLVPFMHVEIQGSAPAVPAGPGPALLLGHMWTPTHTEVVAARASAGTGALDTLYLVADDGARLFGLNSMLHRMVQKFRKKDPFGVLYAIAVPEHANAVQATFTLTFNGTADPGGKVFLQLGGRAITVPVAAGDEDTDIATAVSVAINDETQELGAYATVIAKVVTVHVQVKGAIGESFDVRVNANGPALGEYLPPGLSLVIASAETGAQWPSLVAAIAAMGDERFDVIAQPWWSTAGGTDPYWLLRSELQSRWDWERALYGHAVTARAVTRAEAEDDFTSNGSAFALLLSEASVMNDAHVTVVPYYDSTSPAWEWTASAAGLFSRYYGADPARQLTGLALDDIGAPPKASRFSLAERNALLKAGLATWNVVGGAAVAARMVTTYTKNGLGAVDATWRDSTTPFTAFRSVTELKSVITSKYARAKLVDDSPRLLPLPSTAGDVSYVTPSMLRAELLAKAAEFVERVWWEDYDGFKATLRVLRNKSDRNRVDFYVHPNFANQARVFAMLFDFAV